MRNIIGLLALAALPLLHGCAAVAVGGAAATGVVMGEDRRTVGTITEDQGIEFKASSRVGEKFPNTHLNFTSYNRMLLLTGEVPEEAQRGRIEQALAKIENVKSVVNELVVSGNSSSTSRANDLQLGLKVKASFVEAKDVFANATKVIVERANVYLMGRVTEREAVRAAELASQVPGVAKVVRVFELISEEELAKLMPAPAK